MWKRTGEWVLCDCGDFFLDIDEYRNGEDQMIFCHVRYNVWTKASFKESARVFRTFRAAVDCPLYVIGDEGDRKFARFVAHFGFKPLSSIHCTDGKRRLLYVSFKENVVLKHVQ